MKIVHISPFYWPVIGGVETVVSKISEYFVQQGHDVSVITYNRDMLGRKRNFQLKETINGVNVLRIRPTLMCSYGSYSNELPQTLSKLRPEIVHVHAWRHPHIFQVVKLKKKLSFKLILHGHAPFHKLRQIGAVIWTYHRVIDTLFKEVLNGFDKIIALTPDEENVLVRKSPKIRNKIVILPNGIDDEFIDRASRNSIPDPNSMPSTVIYLGRISKVKGLMLLTKAMRYVIPKVEDAELILAGPDECYLHKLRRYAQRHNILLRYNGVVTGEKKHELYRKCKVFVNPSIYEAYGITLLEAQAYGRPCVITGTGGQVCVSPPNITSIHSLPDARTYGETIVKLLIDTSLYRKLSENARKRAQRYKWSNILPLYNSMYEELIVS